MPEAPRVTVVGGGFAGVECAWQLARRGHRVRLVEMRPVRKTEAHATDRLAEMVCSNSFRSDNPQNAVGLLKREMEIVGSVVLEEARQAAVPAGRRPRRRPGDLRRGSHAPDRRDGRRSTSSGRRSDPLDEALRGAEYVVVATGPLTSEALAASLKEALGDELLSISTTPSHRSWRPRRSTARSSSPRAGGERAAATTT